MSEKNQQHDITKMPVVYKIPGMDCVNIQRNIIYRKIGTENLTMDVYSPDASKNEERRPVVIFVFGFPMFGHKLKEIQGYISWGQLVAACGLVAITYTYQEPLRDLTALLRYIKNNAVSLGIDENRISLWACSGNVPTALSLLMQESDNTFQCAILCYGYMLDLDESTHIKEAANQFGFSNDNVGKSVKDLPQQLPLLLIRAGQDQLPHLNHSLDLFLSEALSQNLPITFINHATGPHTFDLLDASDVSCNIIKSVLEFLQFHLLNNKLN